MRKFAFVVFDIDNSIIDRFSLDLITGISGLGFKLRLSTIEGDIADTLTKVVQEKQAVNLTINFVGNGYAKYSVLAQWLQKYSVADRRLALEYDDGLRPQYVEGKVTELKKTEKDEYDNLSCSAVFTPLTPFFVNIQHAIKISVASVGKAYTFHYPYSYGKNVVENNSIDNPYITAVPVTVKITGAIYEPTVQLLGADGISYCRVQFTGVTLTDGQYIIVNSAARKIYFFDGNSIRDYSAETDPNYDTFLLAESGISTLSVNLEQNDTGELTGSWRQYGL